MSARITSRANRQSGPPRIAHAGLVVCRAAAASRASAFPPVGYSSVDNQAAWDVAGLDGGQVSQRQVHAEILQHCRRCLSGCQSSNDIK